MNDASGQPSTSMSRRSREPAAIVRLDPVENEARTLWREALEVLEQLDGEWTLVGGLMVQLHAARASEPATRPTVDIDVLGNSRKRPSATERIAQTLHELGFKIGEILVEPSTAFRFVRDGTIVDVLAPEGTGFRNPPKTIDGYQTIQIAGGSQALARTEIIGVNLEERATIVRCPSLLGAILLKSRAIRKQHRDQDREDLTLLLACVEDPVALADELKPSERKWLRGAERRLRLNEVDLGDIFTDDQLARARAAYRLLAA